MIIAEEKKKNNIAEYVLYMWQVEDLIRACHLNMDEIKNQLIKKYDQPPEKMREIEAWYESLLEMMQDENKQEKGHLQFVEDKVDELNVLHKKLLKDQDKKYSELYEWALPNIMEFRKKSNNDSDHDIKVCFNALYAFLLLRLKNQEISTETQDAVTTFSNLLRYLSAKYHQ